MNDAFYFSNEGDDDDDPGNNIEPPISLRSPRGFLGAVPPVQMLAGFQRSVRVANDRHKEEATAGLPGCRLAIVETQRLRPSGPLIPHWWVVEM